MIMMSKNDVIYVVCLPGHLCQSALLANPFKKHLFGLVEFYQFCNATGALEIAARAVDMI